MSAVTTAVTGVSSDLVAEVPTMVTAGLAVGGTILAAAIGWKVFKKFVR